MSTPRASKQAPVAAPSPGAVPTTRAHYRRHVERLVRRQLALARNGLIGSPEWHLAFRNDAELIRDFSGWARIDAPSVSIEDALNDTEDDVIPVWEIWEGIASHRNGPQMPAHAKRHRIPMNDEDPAVLRAVNLLVAYVSQEWLTALEHQQPDEAPTTTWMPATFFAPLKLATPDNLRKWRDKGLIEGTRERDPGGVRYEISSVLRHLKLPMEVIERLDDNWLKTAAPDLGGPRPDSERLPADSGGLQRMAHSRARERVQHPAHEPTQTAPAKRKAAQAQRAGAANRTPPVGH